MAIRGGCLCGAIQYEVNGPLFDVSNCHCSMCRRFHGAAFSTYAKFNAKGFSLAARRDGPQSLRIIAW